MFGRRTFLALTCALALLGLAVARPSSGAGTEIRHVVRAGETLWSIAQTRDPGDPRAAIWEIRQRNGLESGALAPGTLLYLPP